MSTSDGTRLDDLGDGLAAQPCDEAFPFGHGSINRRTTGTGTGYGDVAVSWLVQDIGPAVDQLGRYTLSVLRLFNGDGEGT